MQTRRPSSQSRPGGSPEAEQRSGPLEREPLQPAAATRMNSSSSGIGGTCYVRPSRPSLDHEALSRRESDQNHIGGNECCRYERTAKGGPLSTSFWCSIRTGYVVRMLFYVVE